MIHEINTSHNSKREKEKWETPGRANLSWAEA